MMGFEEMLLEIYDTEKNIKIESFFDSGWHFHIGDPYNGFTEYKNFDSLRKGVEWLYDTLVT